MRASSASRFVTVTVVVIGSAVIGVPAAFAGEANGAEPLVPAVVAKIDLAPGDLVDEKVVALGSVPERWVNSGAVVVPDSAAYIRNQRLAVPVAKGEALRWTSFETFSVPQAELFEACSRLRPPSDRDPPRTVQALRASFLRASKRSPVEGNAPQSDVSSEMLVVTRDLAPGTELGPDDVEVAAVPRHLLTASLVTPADLKHVVGRTVEVAVPPGDALTWTTFVRHAREDDLKRCVEASHDQVLSLGANALAKFLADLEKRTAASTAPPALPEPRPSDDGMVTVVVFAREVKEGTTVGEADFALAKVPKELATASQVGQQDEARLRGATLRFSALPGDVARWQYFDREKGTPTLNGCVARAVEVRKRLRTSEAEKHAAKFFRAQVKR